MKHWITILGLLVMSACAEAQTPNDELKTAAPEAAGRI